MTRILHTAYSLEFGGISRLMLDLSVAQIKRGHEVEVLVSRQGGEDGKLFDDQGIGVNVVELSGGFDLRRAKVAANREIIQDFDVVQMHTFSPNVAMAAAQSGAPIVYTEHGNFGFGRKTTIRDRIKRKWLNHFLNRSVSYLSFNSRFTMGVAEDRYRLRLPHRGVVENGIDFSVRSGGIPELPPEWNARLADKFIVGTTSRFAGFKRVDRLIDGFEQFARDKNDVLLLLVGDGTLRHDLETQTGKLGMEDKVIFAGYQSNVARFQETMDVCVFPSQREPFGLVAVETLSLGKPTLVFRDGGGIVDIVEDVEPEHVVESESQLAKLIDQHYSNRSLAKQGIDARKAHAQNYSISRMAEKFDDVYKLVGAKQC